MSEGADRLIQWIEARLGGPLAPPLLSLLALLIVAFLVQVIAPERRRYLRVSVLFSLFYWVCAVAAALLMWVGWQEWGHKVRLVAAFFLEAQGVSLAAIVGFFLILPRTRVAVPDIIRDLIVGSAYFIAFLSLLRGFGVEVWSLLATSAVASLLVGVSVQPTLSSIFGGVTLQLDGSVREGDWVRLPDKQEGRVREIRWRHTLIETRNGDTLILPNSQLSQQQFLVLGRREGQKLQHRMWVNFSVDARFPPERVVEVVVEAVQGAPFENVSASPRPDCICLNLASSADSGAVQYAVRYWLTDLSRDDPTSSLVALRVHTALMRAGIPLAQPQRRVTTSKENARAQLSEQREELTRRVELLKQVELFENLQPGELEALAPKLRSAPFCKNEVISRQGAEAHWLYILVSGVAQSRVQLPSGVERVIGEVRAPDIFGEFGLLTGAPRRETVVATSRVECLRLDKADLHSLILQRPEIAEELSQKLAERQLRFDQTLADMGEPSNQRDSYAEGHFFASIKRFFGLDDEVPPSRASRV